jgi:hypothetical protein
MFAGPMAAMEWVAQTAAWLPDFDALISVKRQGEQKCTSSEFPLGRLHWG